VTLHDQSLTDRKDEDCAALQPAYVIAGLQHLDHSGYLQGDFVTVRGSGGRAFEADRRFLYGRHDGRFEQVMAYYAITRAPRSTSSVSASRTSSPTASRSR
jgi:hypothetical protein